MISLKCRILKNDTNELIYKTETDSDLEWNYSDQGGSVEGEIHSVWDWHLHTAIFKIKLFSMKKKWVTKKKICYFFCNSGKPPFT